MTTMPNLNTVTFPDVVKLADVIWVNEMEKLNIEMRGSGIFREKVWEANSGDTREYSEFDTNQYARNKDEGAEAQESLIQVGYSKIARLVRRAENTSVTWEMRNRNKYDKFINDITMLPEKIAGRMELDMQHRITFMTATSYTDMDGKTIDTSLGDSKALAATDHPLKASSDTYRNLLAGNPRLSQGAMEAIERQAIENTLDHFGTKKTVPYDILWTTDDPTDVHMARKLLQSSAEVAAPNNGVINVYRGKYKHVVLSRVATDATGAPDSDKAHYWGIASSKYTTAYLAMEQEPTMLKPMVAGKELTFENAEDVGTDNLTWRGRGSYSICIVGARWIHASQGNGDA